MMKRGVTSVGVVLGESIQIIMTLHFLKIR